MMPQDDLVSADRAAFEGSATVNTAVTATPSATISATADVADSARIGAGSRIWQLAQVGDDAVVGRGCVVGRGAYIGPGVVVGDHVKIQNYALVYQPARLEDGVFVGPAAVLTNDLNPRAVEVDGSPKAAADWTPVAVHVKEGASLGARSVCVAPVTIGRWAMVGAGAVVVEDVPDFALVVGVPARRVGWVGRAGFGLRRSADETWHCEKTGERYVETEGSLYEIPA
jgi:UDP-2-acetamido-3-amino-2,3-dideoxy-glucuronate N-acetyltransferase